MKKILLFSSILVGILLFASCKNAQNQRGKSSDTEVVLNEESATDGVSWYIGEWVSEDKSLIISEPNKITLKNYAFDTPSFETEYEISEDGKVLTAFGADDSWDFQLNQAGRTISDRSTVFTRKDNKNK